MRAASPLETLLGLPSTDLAMHLAIGLLLLIAVAIAWLAARRREAGRRFGSVLAFLAIAIAGDALWLAVPLVFSKAVWALVLTAFSFALVTALVIAVDVAARRRRAEFSTIFRDVITLFLYGVIILVVMRVALDVDVTPLIATSAVVTAVIGLALQETLGNVFSGISLQIQKPFMPGDWVHIGSYLGRVQGIGWRSTRLITRHLEILDVPNGQLARETITTHRGTVADDLFVGVSYRTPPNTTKAVVERILAHTAEVMKQPPPQVYVVEYGDFAVSYRIRFWMRDYGRQEAIRDAIMTSIWYAFRRNGIEIPYPIRTLHMGEAGGDARERDQIESQRIETLRQVDFLRELSDDEMAVLVPTVYEAAFGRGEIICREGDEGDTFYVLRRGRVEVTAAALDGTTRHINELGPPSVFGEMSLLTGEPRSATVRAKTDTELLILEREGFEQLFHLRPSIAEAISRIIAPRQVELRERRELAQPSETPESLSRRLLLRMHSIFRF